MKKLMFATALVASAAAFATNGTALNAISFEGYTADTGVGSGAGDIAEAGGATGTAYFYYDGDADGSLVKTFASGDAGAVDQDVTRPYFFQGATPALNYLELNTEGGTLWRSINASSANGLGTAANVAATGTYLDTLVQFTPTEDGGDPPLESGVDKLAIWLNVDANGVTNLMVRASYVEDPGNVTCTPTNYIVSCSKDIVAGTWYRLTVKALPDVTKAGGANAIMGFQIFVDSEPVEALMTPFASSYISTATSPDWGWINDETTVPLLQSRTVFPSVLGKSAYSTLQGVGFKGSGAIDDLVWTETDPFPVPPLEFTLTWTAAEVSTVSYVLSTAPATTNALQNGTAVQIAAGTQGTIELIPTFAAGYEFDYVDMGGTQLGLTFAVPAESTNATLVAKSSAPAYPTYLDTADATIKAKYNAWKTEYGADANSQYETAFLLNMDPSTSIPVGTPLLKIASITEVSGGWELEIVSGATTLTADTTNGTVGNGYLAITYAADLATLASGGTSVNLPVTVTGGKITVTVTAQNAKFMKAKLSATAEPQN